MNYVELSLNGTWEMAYTEEKYSGHDNPWQIYVVKPEEDSASVEKAVPGYWEDMTESFIRTPFFRKLRVNPEYGIQKYPMTGFPPDMALPNIMGNFFYRRTFLSENTS